MRKSWLYVLGLVVAALVALGLVVLFSASEIRASMRYHDSLHFIKRQGVFVGVGLFIAFVLALFDYRNWRKHQGLTVFIFACTFIALLLVFCWDPVKGSQRWIPLGRINFQPGEFAKLATVFGVAVWLDRAALKIERFREGTLWPLAIISLMAAPVMFQPDFGSVVVIGAVGFMLMFIAGSNFLHMMPFLVGGFSVFAWQVLTTPNRLARLSAFAGIKIEGADIVSYQSDMSLVAIHRGGVFGKGLLKSMQKQNYLPEAWTDFIFAVGAEEMGFCFSIGVIVLFIILFLACLHIARNASDRFGQLITMGMTFLIFFPAMFNVCVVCDMAPTKGMALPFFSYGGTHILASFVALGMIFSVGIHTLRDKKRAFVRKVVKN